MGARQKLNSWHLNTAIGLAAVAGLLMESTLVFCLALALLVAARIHSGSIRPDQPRKPPQRPARRH